MAAVWPDGQAIATTRIAISITTHTMIEIICFLVVFTENTNTVSHPAFLDCYTICSKGGKYALPAASDGAADNPRRSGQRAGFQGQRTNIQITGK